MPATNENNQGYSSLRHPAAKMPDGENGRGDASVSAFKRREKNSVDTGTEVRPRRVQRAEEARPEVIAGHDGDGFDEILQENREPAAAVIASLPDEEEDHSKALIKEKKRKTKERDRKMLSGDNWLFRNGHSVSYFGIFLFTLVLYFRPYELFPALSGLTGLAFYISIATLVFFIPSQLAAEGNLTARPPEMNYLLLLTLLGLATMPIARSPGFAWETFNDVFIKIVLMFIVMINVLRTERRLKGLMWLSVGVGLMLSIDALKRYASGEFTVEEYRVSVQFGGMFGNPNELATHFVMFIPIAVVLGLATKNFAARIFYWGSALLMVGGVVVTFSRGAFLGLIVSTVLLGWKLGRKNRFQIMAIMAVFGLAFIALAPGNYGLRILSIFVPGLDPVGSSNQRSELLKQSIWVTLRNPWGVGMGNFSIGSSHNLVTHNAYTQVSSELGIVGLVLYVLFIVSPLKRLGAIERELFDNEEFNWMYYLAIGIQASIVAYMVASFFGAFAYNWFVYYPVAYAIALRRIYLTGKEVGERKSAAEANGALELQTA
jgi:hypothetical protein